MPIWNETGTNSAINSWSLDSVATSDFWVLEFLRNCFGYVTVLVPGLLLVRYYQQRREWFDLDQPQSLYKKFITLFVFGWKSTNIDPHISDAQQRLHVIDTIRSSKYGKQFLFAFCFVGLLFSHLVWGFYQEKMMTRDYFSTVDEASSTVSTAPVGERFRDSQFIVFLNRISALAVSMSYLAVCFILRRRDRNSKSPSFEHAAPFYKYSYASLSNILSSWCQYEALKYISFPTQVLGKASKIIPTMIVGRLLLHKSYACHQYVTSAFISAGVSLFLLSRATDAVSRVSRKTATDTTSISGVFMMCGYLLFDSFTSNWQSSLFQEYGVGEMQMMCGVNLFSTLFTFIPLLEQGNFFKSVQFMTRHRDFCFDCLFASLSSTIGQLFIFFTISEFGPVALAVIMTVRQAFAILLSCLYYGHNVGELGVLGLVVVFLALFAGQYLNKFCGNSQRAHRRRT